MKTKKAFITGITGQDGSYLAELLLEKGYEVHGFVRRVAVESGAARLSRLNPILNKVILHGGTIENYSSIYNVMSQVRPDECYHLAAQSFVAESFKDPFSSVHINIMGTLNILESVRQLVPECRFYFAASSEMFGEVQETPQTENTPFYPRSPYGVTKVAGFDLTRNYRESYGLFGCSGILFNHESPRRGYEFVTRKISSNIAGIVNGTVKSFSLGNINAKRDWGYAGDFVQAMWLMLQQDDPDDYVIATGETHSIKDFLDAAFDIVDLRWEDYVTIDPKLYRPAEVHLLRGDSTKANVKLGWEPKISFRELVARMVACDLMIK